MLVAGLEPISSILKSLGISNVGCFITLGAFFVLVAVDAGEMNCRVQKVLVPPPHTPNSVAQPKKGQERRRSTKMKN